MLGGNQFGKLGGGEQWFLDAVNSRADGKSPVRIDKDRFAVGRGSGNDLSLTTDSVSEWHARFLQSGSRLHLVDLDSTAGTFINGIRTAPNACIELIPGDLVQFGDTAVRVERREADAGDSCASGAADDLALLQFEKLLATNSLIPHFQPIVNLDAGRTVGYEALVRSRVFQNAAGLFQAAEKVGREIALSRTAREQSLRQGFSLVAENEIHLNLHPREVADPQVIASLEALRRQWIDQAITVEIHAGSIADPQSLSPMLSQMRDLEIKVAFDDFGAAATRLPELLRLQPNYLKFDVGMIRNIADTPAQQRGFLKSLVQASRDVGVIPLAERLEHTDDVESCREAGFLLAQGFYFGEPQPASGFRG